MYKMFIFYTTQLVNEFVACHFTAKHF